MTAGKTRLPITCSKYEPDHDGRRCRHYGGRGACVRPDEFMCVEWLKANGYAVAPAGPVPPPIAHNFFGDPMSVESPLPSGSLSRASSASASTASTTPLPLRPLSSLAPLPRKAPQAQVLLSVRDSDIASFKALGTEVRLVDEFLGEVWIVPTYTGQNRAELSVEHAALLAAICSAFPGASVASFANPRRPPAEGWRLCLR